MNPADSERPYLALFIDVPSIAALASRCVRSTSTLPGLDDLEVRRFLKMACNVDPRPMLMDEEFDLRFRFDIFAAMVAPLVQLAQCYSAGIDRNRARDDKFTIYLQVLVLTIQTLCAGLELFAAVRTSALAAAEPVRRTIEAVSEIYVSELSQLLAGVADVLDRQDLLSAVEAKSLGGALRLASQRLPPMASVPAAKGSQFPCPHPRAG